MIAEDYDGRNGYHNHFGVRRELIELHAEHIIAVFNSTRIIDNCDYFNNIAIRIIKSS